MGIPKATATVNTLLQPPGFAEVTGGLKHNTGVRCECRWELEARAAGSAPHRARLGVSSRALVATLLAAVLASPLARGEVTGYLAPRQDAVVNGAGAEVTPSEVETPPDWRHRVPGIDETDSGFRTAAVRSS
jgi:hypothetical protein